MASKIWIASSPVINSGYEHIYLVYDPDGDPTSGDELVFRGGPESLNIANSGSVTIENWIPIDDSADALDPGEDPYVDRNYTELGLNGNTAEQVKTLLSNFAEALGTSSNSKITTEVPYTYPISASNYDWRPCLNSNTTIRSALQYADIDFFANTPKEGGTGTRISAAIFPGSESYFTASDSAIISDINVDRIYYSTGGNNIYEFNTNSFATGTIHIFEDDDAGEGILNTARIAGYRGQFL